MALGIPSRGSVGNPLAKPFSYVVRGESIFDIPGTYNWVCPPGVSSVSVVCVGAGATGFGTGSAGGLAHGGGGGALGWKNDIPVISGQVYQIIVGLGSGSNNGSITPTAGESSSAFGIIAGGGQTPGGNGGAGGTFSGADGGGNGGSGGTATVDSVPAGGGGAGGYTGAGGNGASSVSDGGNGTGGAGGGSGSASSSSNTTSGGVGLFGLGINGVGYIRSTNTPATGGSGGENGFGTLNGLREPSRFGAGGGGGSIINGGFGAPGGASGAVRIIWPGKTRLFPSTDVGNP